MGFKGYKFTWCYSTISPNTIRARLDRVCATQDFLNLYSGSSVQQIHSLYLDHIPVKLSVSKSSYAPTDQQKDHRRRKFMFEAMWVKSSECESVIKQAWEMNLSDNTCDNF